VELEGLKEAMLEELASRVAWSPRSYPVRARCWPSWSTCCWASLSRRARSS